jgi:hypothetical protein
VAVESYKYENINAGNYNMGSAGNVTVKLDNDRLLEIGIYDIAYPSRLCARIVYLTTTGTKRIDSYGDVQYSDYNISDSSGIQRVVELSTGRFFVIENYKAYIVTVSGQTVTFGAPVGNLPSIIQPDGIGLIDTDKILVSYIISNIGYVMIITTTGDVISFGTPFEYQPVVGPYYVSFSNAKGCNSLGIISTTQAVVCYYMRDNISVGLNTQVLDISGTTITGNTRTTIIVEVFDFPLNAMNLWLSKMSSTKFFISYYKKDGSDTVALRIGYINISGTNATLSIANTGLLFNQGSGYSVNYVLDSDTAVLKASNDIYYIDITSADRPALIYSEDSVGSISSHPFIVFSQYSICDINSSNKYLFILLKDNTIDSIIDYEKLLEVGVGEEIEIVSFYGYGTCYLNLDERNYRYKDRYKLFINSNNSGTYVRYMANSPIVLKAGDSLWWESTSDDFGIKIYGVKRT